MHTAIEEKRVAAPPADMAAATRVDLYATILKALRATMCNTMLALGRLDPHDVRDVVRSHVDDTGWAKLARALGIAAQPGLVSDMA